MDKQDLQNLNKTTEKANDLAQALANLSKEKTTSSEHKVVVISQVSSSENNTEKYNNTEKNLKIRTEDERTSTKVHVQNDNNNYNNQQRGYHSTDNSGNEQRAYRDTSGSSNKQEAYTETNRVRVSAYHANPNVSGAQFSRVSVRSEGPFAKHSEVTDNRAKMAHAVVADGRPKMRSGKEEQDTVKIRVSEYTINSGAHNPRHNMDMTGIANAAVEAARSTVDDADAMRGKRELEKYGALFGVGTASRNALKKDIERSLYGKNAPNTVRANIIKDSVQNAKGGNYVTNDTRSRNVIKDFEASKRSVENALKAHGINASNYTMKDIEKALKTNIAGSTRTGVILNSETRILLLELRRLKGQEGQIQKLKSAKGGIKNTAKAWAENAMEDSDAYQGYKTVKGISDAAKAGGTFAKVGVGASANLAATSAQVVANVGSFAAQGATKVSGEIYRHAVGVNSEKARKWTQRHARDGEKFRVQRRNINEKATNFRNSSARFQQRGLAGNVSALFARTSVGKQFNTWKAKQIGKFQSTKFGKGLKTLRIGGKRVGMAFNKLTAPIRLPFKLVNAVQKVVQKLAIALAGYFLILIIIIIVVLSITSLFMVDNVGSSDNGEVEYGQEAVDYVWEKQSELINYLRTGNINDKYKPVPDAWATERGNIEKDIATIKGNAQSTGEAGNGQNGGGNSQTTEGTESQSAEVEVTVAANYVALDEKGLQKAVIACACAIIKEDTPKSIFLDYCKVVGDKIFDTATFTRSVSGTNITVSISININAAALEGIAMKAIESNSDFLKYAIDYNSDGEITVDDFDEDYAELVLGMDEETLEEASGIILHGNAATVILEADIEGLVAQIKANYLTMFGEELPANRESLVRSALFCVGKATYGMGGGHATLTDVPNTPVPSTLDCSGFVSYALAHSGTDATHNVRTATGFASCYTDVSSSFQSGYDKIRPGTIIVKNKNSASKVNGKWVYNGNGEANHVVIFIGYASPEGKDTPRPCIVECTTYNGVSGVQITPETRVTYIKGKYLYARDPFQ